MTLGAVQYLATARTALEMSGRVDTDSHIKLPTNLRNGQFLSISSSSKCADLSSTESRSTVVYCVRTEFGRRYRYIANKGIGDDGMCCKFITALRVRDQKESTELAAHAR